ncbi:SRF-TF-domain-containing protein [Ceratobasidium sp. AG-I]|nr:SRF-TF-domain-containing protein [Ceratobasidium sp. AG-I]
MKRQAALGKVGPTPLVAPLVIDHAIGTEKKAGRRKIKIEFIQDKSRRHITFSKRKAGIMKKAYELSTLTGTQVLLLVVSETGLVYTFTTAKLQPLVTQPEGKNLIQACLNAPNGTLPGGGPSGPGMPPPPPAPRSRANINLGMTGGTSPSHDAEGEDDGEGSADSPSMGSAKGRRRRRTNSSSGAVPGSMNKALGSPSESLPASSPTLSMQQPHGMFYTFCAVSSDSIRFFRQRLWRSSSLWRAPPGGSLSHPASATPSLTPPHG